MGVMKPLICKYCDSEWDSVRSKKSYMAQDSLDCIYCMYCDKPNYIAFDDENEAQYKSIIRKKWIVNFILSVLWIPIVIVILLLWQPSLKELILKNIGWVVLILFMHYPFVSFMLPKKQRKKLMWIYGHLSKTTYKEA